METYSQLSRAQLSFDYLHTNSTTHEFLFGAIAELIDNSRDAGATELDIFTVKDASLRGGFMLYFVDNGCGMSSDEARNVIVFGKSFKRSTDGSSIGMYGNGLKSGSMRVGNDMILFTKRDSVCSCLFLSRSFHEAEKLDEVIVPLPTFRAEDKAPIINTTEDQKKYDIEMQIILKYSPFRCVKDFFSQFDKIKGDCGTLVIIYNMKLLDNGSAELDITTDTRDILLAASSDLDDPMEPHADIELPPEKRSLRAYVSILYADPRMKVYIQSRKVQTKRLLDSLYATKRYNFASKTFRTRAERDLAKAKSDVKVAELRAKEAESKARDCELRYEDSKDPEHLKQVRRLNGVAAEMRSLVAIRQNTVARKQKALKDPKTLTFYFGMNVVNRACDGMFVYNCSRLIKMYQRIGPQQDSSMMCRGVVGIVDVPYMVLEPTHNKQDFADAKEFRQLMRAMADHLMQYWDDLAIDKSGHEDTNRFWKSFGYLSARWRDPPSNEDKYARKRYSCVSLCVQCDKCLKWRVLPYSQNQIGRDVPDSWQCRDNPDQKHKRCDAPEEDMNIQVGVLKRKIKTKEQRQAELEAQIRKKQEELEQIRDPDDEPTTRGRSSAAAARRSLAFPRAPPSPPATAPKRAAAAKAATAMASRTVTVADKKRMTAAAAQASMSSASRRLQSAKATTSPAKTKQSKVRRVVHHESSESEEESTAEEEEEEQEDHDVVAQGQKTTVTTTARNTSDNWNRKAPLSITTSNSAAPTNEGGVNEKVITYDILKSTLSKKRQAADNREEEVAVDGVNAVADSKSSTPSQQQQKGTASAGIANGTVTKISPQSSFQQGDEAGMSRTLQKTSGSKPTTPTEKISEKFKVTLRYFLPPQWPMQKDHIHTLTEAELAEFPLEEFFDRYEQGLRTLLSNFQQEAHIFGDTLQNLRKNVAALLDKAAPEMQASSLEGEAVDQLLEDYLMKNT